MKQILFICIALLAGVSSSCQKADPVEPAVEISDDNTLTRFIENNYVIDGPISIPSDGGGLYTVQCPENYSAGWSISPMVYLLISMDSRSIEVIPWGYEGSLTLSVTVSDENGRTVGHGSLTIFSKPPLDGELIFF